MTLNEITALLRGAKLGKSGYRALCPSHNDHNASLSVSETSDRILLHCHACCSIDEICGALGIKTSDLFKEPSKAPPGHSDARKEGQAVAIYSYTDEDGRELFQSVRFEPKGFSQRHYKNGKEIWNLRGIRIVPYKLHKLINADIESSVFIVEGEKDVEVLLSKGLIATCNPMGAGKWREEYAVYLKNRSCLIFPDNDEAGRKHAETVARSLLGIAKTVRIVNLPNLPEKGDVSDFLDTHSIEDLLKLAKEAEVYVATDITPGSYRGRFSPLQTVRMSDVIGEDTEWLWSPYIPFGSFSIVEGEEGVGKTSLLLAIAVAVANGSGLPISQIKDDLAPGHVLLMSAEDSLKHTIKPRLEAMGARCENIIAVEEHFVLDRDGIARLEAVLAQWEPKLVIIDPLFSYAGRINLNSDNEVRSVTNELARLAQKFECSIIGARHIGKSRGMGDARNAGLNGIGWRAAARSVLLAGKDPEDDTDRALVQTKNNLAPLSKVAIGYEIKDGQFLWKRESQLTAEKILSNARPENLRAEQSEAVSYLNDALSLEEREVRELQKEAQILGISGKQLQTAKRKLNVKWRREGFGKDSKILWRLPHIEPSSVKQLIIDVTKADEGHLLLNSIDKTSSNNGLRIDDRFRAKEHL